MAHFAKLGLDNIVLDVVVVDNINTMRSDGTEDESIGVEYLRKMFGHEIWKKCSYNTIAGKHRTNGTPFRKNFPSIGYTYDSQRDAFIPPKPVGLNSYVLNEETCLWEPPIPVPNDGTNDKMYTWNEETQEWLVYQRPAE